MDKMINNASPIGIPLKDAIICITCEVLRVGQRAHTGEFLIDKCPRCGSQAAVEVWKELKNRKEQTKEPTFLPVEK